MYRTFVLLCYLLSFYSFGGEDRGTYIKDERYKVGDDIRWAAPDFTDNHWKAVFDGLPKEQTVYWIRSHVMVDAQASPAPMGVYTTTFGSYELYWDGQLIDKSGVVGTDQTSETPGPIVNISRVPDDAYTSGEHIMSMRISSFHSPDIAREAYFGQFFAPFEHLQFNRYKKNLPPIMILGGLLIIALYFLQLYWIYARDKPFLMFSLLCFAVSALLMTESYKGVFGYTYDWHIFRLTLVSFFTGLVSVLLPLFLLYQFELPFKKRLTLAATLVMLAINTWVSGYDFSAEMMFAVAFVWALVIALYAWKKHKQGAMLTVLGLLIVVLTKAFVPFSFQDSLFFPSFGILILCVLTTLTQRMKVTQQERNEALVNSAQLEIMLLKKNIQPHFILNTLTSIEQWIEEEPQTAVKFIDALADEFKVMNAMADQKQVPLAQELDLCRSHLQIMSYRKDMQFELTTTNTNPELLIPPAIIHTLIENALTHNIYLQGTITMTLTQSIVDQGICLELAAPLNLPKNHESQSSGTGLKYIRSRLEESYPGLWDLQEQQTAEHWITKLIFWERT